MSNSDVLVPRIVWHDGCIGFGVEEMTMANMTAELLIGTEGISSNMSHVLELSARRSPTIRPAEAWLSARGPSHSGERSRTDRVIARARRYQVQDITEAALLGAALLGMVAVLL
jgi:hypothetical protein